MSTITPSLLYDYLQCPHKVWRDVHGPQAEKADEENPFLKLLWERGVQHEADVIANFGYAFLDCSRGTEAERIAKTNQALADREEYIYQGILAHGDLFGKPDLLHFDGTEYVPIEIKSGAAEEGGDGDGSGRMKRHYAVQLALYAEILNRRGLNFSRKGYIIDPSGERIEYDLNALRGTRTPETWFQFFERSCKEVSSLLADNERNDPAIMSKCGTCGWYASCKKWAVSADDASQLFYVGRTTRDVFRRDLKTSRIADLVTLDVEALVERKRSDRWFLRGVGPDVLERIILRASLMKNDAEPVMHSRFDFPAVSTDLFFDIESDPTRDFVYLHGFWVRDKRGERFVEFTARTFSPEAERRAWADAIRFIRSHDPEKMAMYYYSSYEKTTYRRLRRKYPDVIGETELEAIFAHPNTIDLYSDFIYPQTDWPRGSYGIKALADYLGFKWRDESPSGALSIQWFNDYLNTSDEKYLNRVLEYNEDDCRATMIVKDYLKRRMDNAVAVQPCLFAEFA